MTDSRTLWDLDVRIRDRNLRAGRVKKDAVRAHLAGLPDVARNAEVLRLRQPGIGNDVETDGGRDARHSYTAFETKNARYRIESVGLGGKPMRAIHKISAAEVAYDDAGRVDGLADADGSVGVDDDKA